MNENCLLSQYISVPTTRPPAPWTGYLTGDSSEKIKRESSSLEVSQAPCKDTAVDRRLDSEQ